MFVDKDSVQIKTGNGSYVNMGQYLLEVEYQYNKLWSSDSGRNLAGKQSGTLVGIFPKLVCQFRKLTKTELETIRPLLDAPSQVVKYYDPMKQDYYEMNTYTGDWSVKNNRIIFGNNKNEGLQISFIARERTQ